MKRFLIALMAMVAVISVKAATVTGGLTNMADKKITYWSVDVNNRPIELSCRIYYKDNADIEFVMINCHATITHNDGCPTGKTPQMEAIKYMISEKCLLICPDYVGFGNSKDKTHPYMCSTLTGRNVLDAYKAAIKYVKEQKKSWSSSYMKISPNYYTINVGYSQGGATALAFQRYLETEATEEDRALVNLKGSVCGAGPYNQNTVFDVYEKGEGAFASLDYPIYLFYVLNGHKATFGETTMRKLELEECFTPEFWAYYQNGFKAKFEAKGTNVDDLNTELKNAGFTTFYSIINADYADRNSKVYRTIHKTLEQSNVLADGWSPSKPVIFYHTNKTTPETGQDIVVPYACTQEALARFEGNCTYVDAIDDYHYRDGSNGLWHSAVFRENLPSSLGSASSVAEGIIMAAAAITGNDSYSFTELNHRVFGARFYAQYLAIRTNMRPTATVDEGTANSTNIEPKETITTVSVAADAASTAGVAERITTSFPYDLPQGEPVFVQFAADVDGFYFGADAPRYKVTLNANGEAVGYTDMTNTEEDFKAGEVYLVSAVDAGENNVLSVKAGTTLNTVASPLAWRELNMRKTNTVDGTAYVSNCMPFAYRPVDATAYAMTQSAILGKVHPVAFTDAVPAGVGTLVENEDAASIVILAPAMDSNGEAVEGNLLTGNYTQVANDKENYLHFGVSNQGNLGFWVYPNKETVRPYSAYIDLNGTSLSKGLSIEGVDDETNGIEEVSSSSLSSSLYNIAGMRVSENAKGIIIKNGKAYLVK